MICVFVAAKGKSLENWMLRLIAMQGSILFRYQGEYPKSYELFQKEEGFTEGKSITFTKILLKSDKSLMQKREKLQR